MSNVDAAGFERYGRGDDAQTAELRRKVEDLQAQLKEREDAAKERLAKQDPNVAQAGVSYPSYPKIKSQEQMKKETPFTPSSMVEKYGVKLAPTRSYTLDLSFHELEIIKGLLEIRRSIEPSGFLTAIIEQIQKAQGRQGY